MNLQRSYHERRSFRQRSTNIRASVRIGYRLVPCTISDLSEGGARLELDGETELPARLWLSWNEQPSEVLCELRHQRGKTAGVQFARPIVIAARAAVEPSTPLSAVSLERAPRRPQAREVTSSASVLIADRRARLRAANGQADAVAEPARYGALGRSRLVSPDALPCDATSIPHVLSAEHGYQAEPLLAQPVVRHGPMPAPPQAYSGAVIDPPPSGPCPQGVPWPLAAASYMAEVIQGNSSPLHPPMPLPARCYELAAGDEIRPPIPACVVPEPPRPMPAWRYRVVLAPQPLAAEAYGI